MAREGLTPPGVLRAGVRLLALAVWLVLCLPPCLLRRALGGPDANPWPRRFLAGCLRIMGLRVRVVGQWAPGRRLLLANHVSWADIPVMAGCTGTAFVAHDGLASMPFLKWLCALNDTVFVARYKRAGVATQVADLRAALARHGTLSMFPESTTSDGSGLLPFKSSLLAALDPLPEGLAVQPVWLDYGLDAPAIAWLGEDTGFMHFIRVLARRRPFDIAMHALPPLTGAALEGRKAMAAATFNAIQREMQK